ncbi:MAG: hypothetical protein IJE44_03525 [Clostridia bacterium]|nr:hypothetical protein [Clostridia bacterium]
MWKCNKCGLELADDVLVCPCGEAKPEETVEAIEAVEAIPETEAVEIPLAEEAIVTEETLEEGKIEEIAEEEAEPKVLNKKIVALICLVLAIILITAGIFGYYLKNRYTKITGENNTITTEDIQITCDSIFSDDIAMKVNGAKIEEDIFEYFMNAAAISYQENYCYDDNYDIDISRLDNFKWSDFYDKETKTTHKDIVITEAVNACAELYSILSLGAKAGVSLTTTEGDMIKETVKSLKATYGDGLEEALEAHGYDSLKQYEKVLTLEANIGSVYNDMSSNLSKYIDKDMSVFNFDSVDDLVYYAKRTAKISLNKDLIDDFDIEISYKDVYEAEQKAMEEAETAEAEATDEEE